MRHLALAALAAIALVCTAAYGVGTPMMTGGLDFPGNSGTLTTITTDRVTMTIAGTAWATARFKVTSAGTATATAQVSLDDGTNFIASAMAVRRSSASANPTVQAISATTLVTNDEWEVPLPANATKFSLLCAGSGTTTSVSLYGGLPFAPGEPIVAVLYDTTSGTNAALDTGTLDVSGWGAIYHFFTMSGGVPAFTMQEVDDAGVSSASLITSAAAFVGAMGNQYGSTTLGGTAGLAAATASLPLPRRLRYQSAAIAAQTSRIRLVARR